VVGGVHATSSALSPADTGAGGRSSNSKEKLDNRKMMWYNLGNS
jgi:hypothetical protein